MVKIVSHISSQLHKPLETATVHWAPSCDLWDPQYDISSRAVDSQMSWWQDLLLPKKNKSLFPTPLSPSPPSLDIHKGRHGHCITDVGTILGTGKTCARAWPLSYEHWLSLAGHMGPWRGKKTWGKTCFAQDFNVSPYVPGSVPKMAMGISPVSLATLYCARIHNYHR